MSKLFLISDQHVQVRQTAHFGSVLDSAITYSSASEFVNSGLLSSADSCLVVYDLPGLAADLSLISRRYPWLSIILISRTGESQELLPVTSRFNYVDMSTSEDVFREVVAGATSQSAIRYTRTRKLQKLQKSLQSLTPRELEVLRLSSTGMATKKIAESLDMSPSTADKHRRRALDKLGASTVVELVNTIIDVPDIWDTVMST